MSLFLQQLTLIAFFLFLTFVLRLIVLSTVGIYKEKLRFPTDQKRGYSMTDRVVVS